MRAPPGGRRFPGEVIRQEGVRALVRALGTVEAERFIALINRERFDYTEWRRGQWQDETVLSPPDDEISLLDLLLVLAENAEGGVLREAVGSA